MIQRGVVFISPLCMILLHLLQTSRQKGQFHSRFELCKLMVGIKIIDIIHQCNAVWKGGSFFSPHEKIDEPRHYSPFLTKVSKDHGYHYTLLFHYTIAGH